MTILLVDDDVGMISLWSRMLGPLQAELRFAQSVEDAIEQMRKVPPPDMVLLDLRIPPNSAEHTVAAIEKLRAFNPNLTVIVISGMKLDEISAAVRNVPVEGVLTKDDSLSQVKLLSAMKSALSKSRGAVDSGALLDRIGTIMERLR